VRSIAGFSLGVCVLLKACSAACAAIPSDALLQRLQPAGRVNDYAALLSPEQRAAMESRLGELEQKTGSQMAVVTLDSMEGGQIDDFTHKLLYLRERYLLTGERPRLVLDLLTASLSTFQVLFRGALRLWQDDVPAQKHDAVQALAARVGFDPQPFATVRDLKEKRVKARGVRPDALFAAYLAAIEQVVTAVDSRVRRPRQ